METTRQTDFQQVHRELILRIKGESDYMGDWQKLMKIAFHYGACDWEILEKVSTLGERLITKHSSLLSNHGEKLK